MLSRSQWSIPYLYSQIRALTVCNMQVKDLLTDDDAVSPVIGVILMVAITVILAAVIAAFVLGLGDTNDVAPNTSFEHNYDQANGDITVRVSSGDTFNSDRISFTGDLPSAIENKKWSDGPAGTTDVQSGDSIQLGGPSGDIGAGSSIGPSHLLELTWTSEGGDTSSVLSSREGPDR